VTILSDKIATLILEPEDIESQVLEVCAILNKPEPIAPVSETKYNLKSVLIPHLIEEGILDPAKLEAIATHPVCADFLKALIRDHYNGATALSSTIQQLLAAGQTFLILTEAEVVAVQDRFDVEKIVEIDEAKPIEQRRYDEWTEEVPQDPISWAMTNLERAIDGSEVLQILGELYGD